jgi:4'-phosphopantetheinyl transferase
LRQACAAQIGRFAFQPESQRRHRVDWERIRPLPELATLVGEHFTAEERGEFECLPKHAQDRAFFVGWTRKEACLKAIGSGLHIAPQRVDVGLAACPRRTQVVFGERYYNVALQSIVHKQGWVGAVAQVLAQGTRTATFAVNAWAEVE